MKKEQKETNALEETYIVGSPCKHTRYSIKDGSIVHSILPYDPKTKTPTSESRIALEDSTPPTEGSTPPIDIPIPPDSDITVTGEWSSYLTNTNSSDNAISPEVEWLGVLGFVE
ncbi:MAG: hypothetical protein AAF673_02830 [Pseudomonadota bacterium]